MELWIPITIAAAFCQNLRSALQKRLRATLSVEGATGARFVYAAPLALALLAALIWGWGDAMPVAPGRFHVYSAIGGLSQIGATWLLIHLFSMRNFAVATGLVFLALCTAGPHVAANVRPAPCGRRDPAGMWRSPARACTRRLAATIGGASPLPPCRRSPSGRRNGRP